MILINKDSESKRPTVGWTVFNEYYLDINKPNINSDVATVVHEVLHALFFHPFLFNEYPKNSDGLSFSFEENQRKYLRGDLLLKTAREYFKCENLSKSKFKKLYKIIQLNRFCC